MVDNIDALVTAYDHGTLTRRQLLQALAVMAAPVGTRTQATNGGVIRHCHFLQE